jgi:Zn-dependent protease
MNFFDTQRETPFDLRFRLFGTDVRVHPLFWVCTALLNISLLSATDGGIEVLLIWVLCVFVSILLHEFGHVWMGRAFGSRASIQLQWLFGLAVGADSGVSNRWQRILIYLAGPGIQLLFFVLLVTGLKFGTVGLTADTLWSLRLQDLIRHDWPRLVRFAVFFLLEINLWWPILNLLPIWPLDGWQVSRELFVWRDRNFGMRNSLALSLAVALLVMVNALSDALGGPSIPYMPSGGKFFVVFFAILAIISFQLLSYESAKIRGGWRDPDDDERMPWERDPDEWKRR